MANVKFSGDDFLCLLLGIFISRFYLKLFYV